MLAAALVGVWLVGALAIFEVRLAWTAGWHIAKRTLLHAGLGIPFCLAAAIAIHGVLVIAASLALMFTLVLVATRGHPDRFMDANYRFLSNEVDEQVRRQHDKLACRIQVAVIASFLILTLPVFLLWSK